MTDLTGAELALAVARVMRRPISTVQPLANGGAIGGLVNPRVVDAARCTWRPDQGGAAAWEVLEWVRREGYEVTFADQDDAPRLVWCCIDAWESDVGTGRGAYGPTDAIALCRAVVALGEAL